MLLAGGVAAGSTQQQPQQPTAAAAMPATTPAAAVAAIFAVVPLLLSLSCAGEAICSAQAPLEVGTARNRLVLYRRGYWVLGTWVNEGQRCYIKQNQSNLSS